MSTLELDGKSILLLSGPMTREERTKNPLGYHTSPKLLLCPLEVVTEMGAAFFGVMGQFSFQRCDRNALNQKNEEGFQKLTC